jgi:hypothetical protein
MTGKPEVSTSIDDFRTMHVSRTAGLETQVGDGAAN